MRQPLEDKSVSIARSTGTLSFPANFMLVSAGNLCPYGNAGLGTCRWQQPIDLGHLMLPSDAGSQYSAER